MKKMLEVSRPEIWRYLGYHDNEPDEPVRGLIEEAIAELEKAAWPRRISRRVLVRIRGRNVGLGPLHVTSKSLAVHLSGCTQAELFAATLGTDVDRLLTRYAHLQVSHATVLQAASAAMIESWCDLCQKELEETLADGVYLRPRFSPGYGDLPLNFQRPLLSFLEADKRIGIELTDSLLMVPSKSVSAIIGLTGDKESCSVHRCSSCEKNDCPFRSGT